tara:strand:+ start:96 stop:305 length:210 start_codon:yes stop_codon:yes gene_type:complete
MSWIGKENASQFLNGKPIFGASKTSDIRQQVAVKKADTPENRTARLELYKIRLEAGLGIFDGSIEGDEG